MREIENLGKYSHDNCWICGGWSEISIKCPHNIVEDRFDDDPLYIHMDIDKFKGRMLNKSDDGTYEVLRVVPPGERIFFFSCNELEVVDTTSK